MKRTHSEPLSVMEEQLQQALTLNNREAIKAYVHQLKNYLEKMLEEL